MDSARILRVLGLISVLFFLASAFTPLANLLDIWNAPAPQLHPADAIVVLASGGASEGVLSSSSALQVRRGIAVYQEGLAPLLVFSGPRGEGDLAEAEVRAELARARGIPAKAILTEAEARTTREEALRQKTLLQPRGTKKILLVANSRHLLRARPLFERVGFEVYGVPSDTYTDPGSPEQRLDLMRGVLMDLVATVYYRLAGFI